MRALSALSHRLRNAAATTALACAALTAAAPDAPACLPPLPHGPETAVVILGYGLLPDGGMRPELIDRLRAGYLEAVLSPASPVIVTGGNPRAGVTEARAMADWLIARGIPEQRVHLESAARSTAENAELSAELMTEIGSRDAVLVTSADHLPRALALFTAAGVNVSDTYTPDDLAELPTPLPFGPLS
ncbi:YdcF family protein [Nocardia sp. CDC160]|uniref:YdcF family protein n=1 Tax=Nocardia sp. CDC160 TaxID=3112166 RepID=UPI002DB8B6CF|nr:YdcF family protein [Nocardia sp. CDC160]MEC3919761.1 YdcF family protein [Nocardia sp. CDC160]